mmetsp:Transcript_45021/g.101644  ORF Transcript_45021/g.101644 Transcript_45021/m.101644 type:complete len:121 (+) Transcript_45021:484-846(+)
MLLGHGFELKERGPVAAAVGPPQAGAEAGARKGARSAHRAPRGAAFVVQTMGESAALGFGRGVLDPWGSTDSSGLSWVDPEGKRRGQEESQGQGGRQRNYCRARGSVVELNGGGTSKGAL